jgi:hypothetical protein
LALDEPKPEMDQAAMATMARNAITLPAQIALLMRDFFSMTFSIG